jgi:hypothetical protein
MKANGDWDANEIGGKEYGEIFFDKGSGGFAGEAGDSVNIWFLKNQLEAEDVNCEKWANQLIVTFPIPNRRILEPGKRKHKYPHSQPEYKNTNIPNYQPE